jgi:hypothetical protein
MNNLAFFHAPSALSRPSYKLQLIALMLTGVSVLTFGAAKTLIVEPEYWFAWSEFHQGTKIYAATEPKR